MTLVIFLLSVLISGHQAGILDVGGDPLREITNYQSFDCECHLRRISTEWQKYIDQGREYGDAEQVDRIIQILSTQPVSKLNESILEIKSIVQGLQNVSRNYDTFPVKYYQALPKIFYIIKSMPGGPNPNEDKKKLLAALQLNVPEFEIKCYPVYFYPEVNTLLKVSRVLLIEYYFPNQFVELNGKKLGKEFIWMCLFTYNTLMDRLYYNATLRRTNEENKYSDLVIPLHHKLLTKMRQRLISEFKKDSFDISQFFNDINSRNNGYFVGNQVTVKCEEIDVRMKMNFCRSRIFEQSLLALLEMYDEHQFTMLARSDEDIDQCPPDSNLSIEIRHWC